MILNKDQKEALKSLTEHRGFKILEEIAEDKRQALFTRFETLALWDKEVMQELSQAQNYNKGMRDLLNTAKAKTQAVISAPDMS